jgi:crotonobetainyl-CoA:carnitine CoA-transferase CaiB-like acyl-CoA transferase
VPGGSATLVSHPNRYDGEAPPLRRLAIAIGEDTREVLAELGYAPAAIDDLVARGAIAAPSKEAVP